MKDIYNADVEVGINMLQLLSDSTIKKAHKKSFDRALKGESFTEVLVSPDKKKFFESNRSPIISNENKIIGINSITKDITNQKKAERQIKKSEIFFKDIPYSMADWIWEVDENGVYTFCLDRSNNILGFSQKEIIGKTPFDFMSPEEAKRIKKIFSEIIKKINK